MVEAATRVQVARLLRESAQDLDAMDARAEELAGLSKELSPAVAPDRRSVLAVAVNLHGYYTAMETLFERVARLLDDRLPAGATWHSELLEQMQAEVPGLRPLVLPQEAVADVHDLRRFRHFFRNAYTMAFDPPVLLEHARRVQRVHPILRRSITALRQQLAAMLAG